MCYAIPGKVVSTDGRVAVVDYFGENRNVLNEFPNVKPGDYVYAQGGVLISTVSEQEAKEVLALWKERFFELKRIDARLSQKTKGSGGANLLAVLDKAGKGIQLDKNDILTILNSDSQDEFDLITTFANNFRQKEHDNACCVHGIIEFSNHCQSDCHYCGIRKSSDIGRYRMGPDEIIESARHAVKELGFKALVLQSGEDFSYDDDLLEHIVKEIRKLGVLIFLSIGMRDKPTYERLYKAGARAVLLRFETSDPALFSRMRPGTRLEERLGLIRELGSMGYLVATGFLIGLPGETSQTIADNILLTRSLGADMYSFGPFIPAKGTPLEDYNIVDRDIALKTIAACRLADKRSKILVTSALETIDMNTKKQGLLAGANSIMVNVTPEKYRKLYTLYPNRAGSNASVEENIKETVELLYSIGRAPTDLGV